MSEAALSLGRARSSGFWSIDTVVDLSTWPRRAIWFIATLTVVRLVIISATGLSDTESYYYVWSRFPALSYYDHPPMVAWMTAVTTLVSKSAFSARVGAVVCSALMGALVYRLAARLFSPRAGFLALVAVSTPPVLFFTSFLVNPESPLAPLWVLSLLLLDDLREHDEPWRPMLLGLTIGAAFLAKYTALLLVPVTLIFLATSRRTRRWLRRPSLYASGLVALTVASPVVIWNYQHHWPTLTLHLVERMSAPSGLTLWRHARHMVFDQFVLYQPLAFPGLLAILGVALARARTDARYRLLASASAPVLLFLFAVMVKVGDAEPHWTMVAFLPLAIAAGGWLDAHIDRASRALRVYLRACVGVSAAFFFVYFVHTQSPVVMRIIPPQLYSANVDAVNETFGWDRIQAAISDEAAKLGPNTVVAGGHNVLCGQVAARLDDRPHVYCPSPRRTEFDFLGRRDPPSDAPVVYVDSARYSENVSKLLPGRSCAQTQTVEVTRDGRALNTYRIYACPAVGAMGAAPGNRIGG
jgi:4-amino-4-deoxy-L-arabinose transferase-like glycosyltransferase